MKSKYISIISIVFFSFRIPNRFFSFIVGHALSVDTCTWAELLMLCKNSIVFRWLNSSNYTLLYSTNKFSYIQGAPHVSIAEIMMLKCYSLLSSLSPIFFTTFALAPCTISKRTISKCLLLNHPLRWVDSKVFIRTFLIQRLLRFYILWINLIKHIPTQ